MVCLPTMMMWLSSVQCALILVWLSITSLTSSSSIFRSMFLSQFTILHPERSGEMIVGKQMFQALFVKTTECGNGKICVIFLK